MTILSAPICFFDGSDIYNEADPSLCARGYLPFGKQGSGTIPY